MADEAIVQSIVTLFPDEVRSVLGTTSAYKTSTTTPADANDKWYYSFIGVGTGVGGNDLIQGSFLEDTSTSVLSTDYVKFLYIENAGGTSANLYVSLDGNTASSGLVHGIIIPATGFWFGTFRGNPVGNIHAASASGSINCVVAAIIDDL